MQRVLITQASNIHAIMTLSHKKPVFAVKIKRVTSPQVPRQHGGPINYVYDSVGWHGIDTVAV